MKLQGTIQKDKTSGFYIEVQGQGEYDGRYYLHPFDIERQKQLIKPEQVITFESYKYKHPNRWDGYAYPGTLVFDTKL